MSPSNQETSETALLLGASQPDGRSNRSPSRERSRFSPETLLIPVAIATRLAPLIPSTTLVDLVRRAVCRAWNISHGNPVTLLANDSIPPEFCNAPEIERYFSAVMATLNAVEGLILMVGCGILSRVASRYGRKPALLILLTFGTVGNCLIPVAQHTPDWLADWIILVGFMSISISHLTLYGYLTNMYIVDVCIPEDRTTALSKIGGWSALGMCISFLLGGSVTTKTGNPAIVFYMSAALFGATIIYVVFVLPESFPKDRRTALLSMQQESSTGVFSRTFLVVFKPLKMLAPTRKLDGTHNWRLALCAVHIFVFMVASSYMSSSWLVFATSKYHLSPAVTGLFLTIASVSGMTVLTVIVPPLVRFLRPYYSKKIVHSLSAEESINVDIEMELETSDRLDVHLAFVSCIIAGISYLSAAASMTYQALIFSAVGVGFSAIHAPTIRSLVAGSVDPLLQGEALAAIEIVSNAGIFLSPIIMGSILTATINTAPLLVFFVHLVAVSVSGALLFLIRDTDKYRKPREA